MSKIFIASIIIILRIQLKIWVILPTQNVLKIDLFD